MERGYISFERFWAIMGFDQLPKLVIDVKYGPIGIMKSPHVKPDPSVLSIKKFDSRTKLTDWDNGPL